MKRSMGLIDRFNLQDGTDSLGHGVSADKKHDRRRPGMVVMQSLMLYQATEWSRRPSNALLVKLVM